MATTVANQQNTLTDCAFRTLAWLSGKSFDNYIKEMGIDTTHPLPAQTLENLRTLIKNTSNGEG